MREVPVSASPLSDPERAGGVRLDVRRLSHGVGEVPILKDVSLAIAPGEMVGLLGPSGSGKSTLLRILAGIETVAEGRVSVDGRDAATGRGELRARLGYVPQQDIVHGMLTVSEVLDYAARLRLPRRMTDVDALVRIHRTLKAVDLEERQDSVVRSLSGGQRKRVCLAVELLSGPPLLLLDEPTSGLDPANEARAMQLFRAIADEGRTLLVSTHQIASVETFDRVALLSEGRLVWFGAPGGLAAAFGAASAAEVYDRLRSRPAAEWEARFRASSPPADERSRAQAQLPSAAAPPAEPRRAQLPVLAMRYARCTLADHRNLGLLLAQAPLIAFLISLAYDAASPWGRRNLLFTSSLAAVWFGCINACREIVKEKAIYDRERMVGLGIVPYAISKLLVLSLLCVVQTVLFLGVLLSREALPGAVSGYAAVFLCTSLASLCLGLLVSSVVDSSDKALSLLPIVLIPQIIFVGVSGESNPISREIGDFMVSRWAYEGMQQVLDGRAAAGSLERLGLFAGVLFACAVGTLFLRREG